MGTWWEGAKKGACVGSGGLCDRLCPYSASASAPLEEVLSQQTGNQGGRGPPLHPEAHPFWLPRIPTEFQ